MELGAGCRVHRGVGRVTVDGDVPNESSQAQSAHEFGEGLRFAGFVQPVERTRSGPLAQRSEQRTHNPLVEGSNPSGPTDRIRNYKSLNVCSVAGTGTFTGTRCSTAESGTVPINLRVSHKH